MLIAQQVASLAITRESNKKAKLRNQNKRNWCRYSLWGRALAGLPVWGASCPPNGVYLFTWMRYLGRCQSIGLTPWKLTSAISLVLITTSEFLLGYDCTALQSVASIRVASVKLPVSHGLYSCSCVRVEVRLLPGEQLKPRLGGEGLEVLWNWPSPTQIWPCQHTNCDITTNSHNDCVVDFSALFKETRSGHEEEEWLQLVLRKSQLYDGCQLI